MRKYPTAHWKALGAEVNTSRMQAGYTDTAKWAEAVGRSSRMLLGLERGEPVGAKTIEAIAEALGVANWSLFQVLDTGRRGDWGGGDDSQVDEARRRYEQETGLEADEGAADLMRMFSDEELLAEVAKRLATRPLSRGERRLREAQGQAGDWSLPSDAPGLKAVAEHDPKDPLEEAEETERST